MKRKYERSKEEKSKARNPGIRRKIHKEISNIPVLKNIFSKKDNNLFFLNK